MNREMFKEAIVAIMEDDKSLDKFSTSIEEFTDSYVVFKPSNSYNFLFKLLKFEMNDVNDFIGWFLYEQSDKIIEINGVKKEIKTLDDLYDLITNEQE